MPISKQVGWRPINGSNSPQNTHFAFLGICPCSLGSSYLTFGLDRASKHCSWTCNIPDTIRLSREKTSNRITAPSSRLLHALKQQAIAVFIPSFLAMLPGWKYVGRLADPPCSLNRMYCGHPFKSDSRLLFLFFSQLCPYPSV